MTREEFAQLAMLIQTLFERQDFLPTQIQRKLWYERLRQYPQDTVKAAVIRLWETQKWMPAMSEMLEAIECVEARRREEQTRLMHEERVFRYCQALKSGERAALPEGN